MKKSLLVTAVLTVVAVHVAGERLSHWRQSMRNAKDMLWIKYDDVVNHVLDTLEDRKIFHQQDYGSNKP